MKGLILPEYHRSRYCDLYCGTHFTRRFGRRSDQHCFRLALLLIDTKPALARLKKDRLNNFKSMKEEKRQIISLSKIGKIDV